MNFLHRLQLVAICAIACITPAMAAAQAAQSTPSLVAAIDQVHGSYSLRAANGASSLHGAAIAAKVDSRWIHPSDYGQPVVVAQNTSAELGKAHGWTVTYSRRGVLPDLIYQLRVYDNLPFADIQVTVKNSTAHAIAVQDIRPVELNTAGGISLGGPDADDRALSDSFSEARPALRIHDLGDTSNQMHRGVEVQLLYNRKSGQSWFAGALTTDKFLTVSRIHLAQSDPAHGIASYEIDCEGTTEFTKENSLRNAVPENQVELSATVIPGQQIASERLLLGLGADYHSQLDTYASIIKQIHHARVSAPAPMGWWSWTAYYSAITQDLVVTNAEWLANNLKSFGYNFLLVDEGYSIERGDYLTPNPQRFPDGMERLEKKVSGLGLLPAVWTAPFEVSDKSWVFLNHPEWLVHNTAGKPILLGNILTDHLYVLDSTHPGAQEYLRKTYSTMVDKWGMRLIKLDFMEDSCIEGEHYRPGTSALEAQRIGLRIIRSAVGEKTILDKDESVMLNPVGIVDIGRISHDTSHKFTTIKGAAFGMAARYYMNRNFFVADPDAFMVTSSSAKGQLSLDEAKVSLAVAVVSGGMLEIGDALPILSAEPDRLALIQNRDLIEISRLGKASIPIDLMDYEPQDGQPSIYFLKQTPQQSILTVFNWTDSDRTRSIRLDMLGLKTNRTYKIVDLWDGKELQACDGCTLNIPQPPHSVQILKIVEAQP